MKLVGSTLLARALGNSVLAWALAGGLAAGVVAACGKDPSPVAAGQGQGAGVDGGAEGGAPGLPDWCAQAGLTQAGCDHWAATVLPASLPPAHGNKYGDDANAVDLGFALFFDPQALSQPGTNVACSRCHSPERGFSDNQALSVGLTITTRNAPPFVNAARAFPHFWDGRADSLWSQPLATMENAGEMNATRTGVAHFIARAYRAKYEAVFGPMPSLDDATRFPAQAKPGMPEWDAMTADDRETINRVYVNVGKALEAYARRVATGRSAVDEYIQGKLDAISPVARHGMAVLEGAGCFGCHGGPTFADGAFHAIDIPPSDYVGMQAVDPGRAAGIPKLAASEFNALSKYYDLAPGEQPSLPDATTADQLTSAFLTPSLRNVSDTSPYGHNGIFTSLDQVVRFHLNGGGPNNHDPLLVKHPLSDDDVAALVEILNALQGAQGPLPWSFWPALTGDAGAYDAGP